VCVRAPLLGREGVSVSSGKYRVCTSRSETMCVSEGLLEPGFFDVKGQKNSCSEDSAPCVW